MFYNRIMDTLNKITVGSSFNSNHYDDPQLLKLSTFDAGKFMFGVEIWNHDLNTGKRYFDIVLRNTYYQNGDAILNHSQTVNITL